MSLRDELFEAMQSEFNGTNKVLTFRAASEFGARWMAEKCAYKASRCVGMDGDLLENPSYVISQMAKELS